MKNTIIQIGLCICIILLVFKTCQMNQEHENLLTQITAYQIGEKAFKTKLLDDSSTLAQQTQTILTQEEAIRTGILKLEGDIKKVQSQVRQSQEISIEDIAVPFVPNGYADTTGWAIRIKEGDRSDSTIDSLLAHSVIVPSKFKKEDKWFSIDGEVQKEGIKVDSLKIENESSVTIGYKKSGFLGLKSTPLVEIKNTNPYLSVTKMNNVVIKPNKNIFKSKLFWGGIGVVGGFILKSKL
jgi:hypothetical protein